MDKANWIPGLALVLVLLVSPTQAQSIMSMAPWELGAQARFVSVERSTGDDSFDSFTVSGSRVVPLSSLLPQVTRDSYLNALTLSLGGRTGDEAAFRYRLSVLNIALQRAYTSGAFTLLDHDQTGSLDRKTVWIGLALGPGFHKKTPSFSVWARIVGGSDWTTLRTGDVLFAGVDQSNHEFSGVDLSYKGVAGFTYGERISTQLLAEAHTLAGRELSSSLRQVKATIATGTRFAFSLGYQKETIEFQENSVTVEGLMGAIRFAPRRPGF